MTEQERLVWAAAFATYEGSPLGAVRRANHSVEMLRAALQRHEQGMKKRAETPELGTKYSVHPDVFRDSISVLKQDDLEMLCEFLEREVPPAAYEPPRSPKRYCRKCGLVQMNNTCCDRETEPC